MFLRVSLLVLFLLSLYDVIGNDPHTFQVEFTVNLGKGQTGTFVVEAHYDWAPLGTTRFLELVKADFFKGIRFFRVIPDFMAQFGVHGDPTISAQWKPKKLMDDPVVKSNKRGFISFATSGKDTRTTQMFINFKDNSNLDSMGFSPFAEVISGMEVVDKIFPVGEGGVGDGKDGKGPSQARIEAEGNKYLKKVFPKLTYITSAKLLDSTDL